MNMICPCLLITSEQKAQLATWHTDPNPCLLFIYGWKNGKVATQRNSSAPWNGKQTFCGNKSSIHEWYVKKICTYYIIEVLSMGPQFHSFVRKEEETATRLLSEGRLGDIVQLLSEKPRLPKISSSNHAALKNFPIGY